MKAAALGTLVFALWILSGVIYEHFSDEEPKSRVVQVMEKNTKQLTEALTCLEMIVEHNSDGHVHTPDEPI